MRRLQVDLIVVGNPNATVEHIRQRITNIIMLLHTADDAGSEGAYLMSEIVEVDERGAIQLPDDLRVTLKPRTRFMLDVQGETIVLRPINQLPFWQSATPQERAEAVRHWAALPRPAAPPLSDTVLHRDQLYD